MAKSGSNVGLLPSDVQNTQSESLFNKIISQFYAYLLSEQANEVELLWNTYPHLQTLFVVKNPESNKSLFFKLIFDFKKISALEIPKIMEFILDNNPLLQTYYRNRKIQFDDDTFAQVSYAEIATLLKDALATNEVSLIAKVLHGNGAIFSIMAELSPADFQYVSKRFDEIQNITNLDIVTATYIKIIKESKEFKEAQARCAALEISKTNGDIEIENPRKRHKQNDMNEPATILPISQVVSGNLYSTQTSFRHNPSSFCYSSGPSSNNNFLGIDEKLMILIAKKFPTISELTQGNNTSKQFLLDDIYFDLLKAYSNKDLNVIGISLAFKHTYNVQIIDLAKYERALAICCSKTSSKIDLSNRPSLVASMGISN